MKTLIIHASAGAGHQRAAEALEAAHHALMPDGEVIVADILDFTPRNYRNTYAKGYLRVVRSAPELWGYMYSRSDDPAPEPWKQKVRSIWNMIHSGDFFDFYDEIDPDVVICTHFMPLEVLSARSRRKNGLRAKLYGVVTDFAVHGLWVLDDVDGYFVSTKEASRTLLRNGYSKNQIWQTGIPVHPVFSERQDAGAARRALGLAPNLPTFMMLTGGYGVGPTLDLLSAFKDHPLDAQLIVVCGRNANLQAAAEEIAAGLSMNSLVLGFADNIHELMDASDIVISKPGGLSTSEILVKHKAMLIIDPIPGQEQRNCEYLLEYGAAARLFEPEDAPWKIDEIIEEDGRLEKIQRCAANLSAPHAAHIIIQKVRDQFEKN